MSKSEAGAVAALFCLVMAAANCAASAQVLSSGPPAYSGLLPPERSELLVPAPMLHMGLPSVLAYDGDSFPDVPLALRFNQGSDRLTVSATRLLDKLGLAMSRGGLAKRHVRIIGHGDIEGSPEARRDMARRRARAVALYLEQNYNIDPSWLRCSGEPAPAKQGRLVFIAAMEN